MTDFLQSILDMGTIHPTIYSGLQVASDDFFVSTEEANRLNLLDFSGIGLETSFETDTDSVYAPFGPDPSFAYGALDSEPFSMDGDLLGYWSIPPSSSGAADTAYEDLVAHIPSLPPIKRSFGSDLSNIERCTADPPPLVSSSTPSSGASTPEVITPADMPSPVSAPISPSPISAPTFSSFSPTLSPSSLASAPAHSSSSPASKSARQRRNAAPSSRPPNRPSASRPRSATIVPADHKVMCIVKKCKEGFGDRTAMLRHVITKHIRERHKCHGCDKSYTRLDALGRHLNTTELGSECRLAAMENGWVQVMSEDGIKMSRPQRTDRVKKVADFLS